MSKREDLWMTVREVAVMKDVAESAVRLALVTSRLAGEKLGREWMVNRQSAEAWTPQRRGPKKREVAA